MYSPTCSGDPKKTVETISQLPKVEGATTQIPHLEGEEIFGNTKRKLDLDQVIMAAFIDLTRSTFYSLEYRLDLVF
jgi:hypothetical protein